MSLLLDTHTFLWALFTPEKLSKRAAQKIASSQDHAAVSIVTFWEISLKYGIGKLELKGIGPEELPDYALRMDLEILDLSPAEASSFHRIPGLSYRDPFDRLIIWQSIQRKLILISKDRAFSAYKEFGLKTYW